MRRYNVFNVEPASLMPFSVGIDFIRQNRTLLNGSAGIDITRRNLTFMDVSTGIDFRRQNLTLIYVSAVIDMTSESDVNICQCGDRHDVRI